MKIITLLYILNASLLILHEIESAYEKEWEILNLPGKISGFLIIHFPLLIILFYGVITINNLSNTGLILGVIFGFCGLLPVFVHKIIVPKKAKFNLTISNFIIYSNLLTGILIFALSLYQLL